MDRAQIKCYPPSRGPPLIHIVSVSKRFHQHNVLREVSLELFPGELLGLIGPSGCGKSTLARCCSALEQIDGGEIGSGDFTLTSDTDLFTDAVAAWRRRVGYVFQQVPLWPGRTALQQISEGLTQVRGFSKPDAIAIAFEWATRFQVREQMSQLPHTLSGGQRQRIGLIRALAIQPEYIILDEVTSGLDPVSSGNLSDQLLQVRRDTNLGILFITHQIEFLKRYADRIAFLYEGQLTEVGPAASTLMSPATRELELFLSSVRQGW